MNQNIAARIDLFHSFRAPEETQPPRHTQFLCQPLIRRGIAFARHFEPNVRRQPRERAHRKLQSFALKPRPREHEHHFARILFPGRGLETFAIRSVVDHMNSLCWETVMPDDLLLAAMRVGDDRARVLRRERAFLNPQQRQMQRIQPEQISNCSRAIAPPLDQPLAMAATAGAADVLADRPLDTQHDVAI